MNAAEFDALVRQFLVDHQLTNSERTMLMDYVAKNISTDQHRSLARSRLFQAARNSVNDPTGLEILTFVEDVIKVLYPSRPPSASQQSDEAVFSPGDACLGVIVNRLNQAKNTADICVFTITDDRIARAVLDAYRRNVKIRIITDNDKADDPGSDIVKFVEAGMDVRVDRTPHHMHHKFAIFDGRRLLNGSYNWTRSAAENNEENLTDTGDPAMIATFQKEFDALWAKLR